MKKLRREKKKEEMRGKAKEVIKVVFWNIACLKKKMERFFELEIFIILGP